MAKYEKSDLRKLYGKAIHYTENRTEEEWGSTNIFEFLYRDEEESYFKKRKICGIMEKVPKDKGSTTPNGDGRSPINYKLHERPSGIFFMANINNYNGEMMDSIYGEKRFKIRMDKMIESCENMWFADF